MAFHFLTTTGIKSTDLGGITPAPLDVNPLQLGHTILPPPTVTGIKAMIDGKLVDCTASLSGTKVYTIVEPGDYPTNADDRYLRSSDSND